MPDMNGPETLNVLRMIPGLESVPVIFMTANVIKKDVERYREMGVLDVIAKPFEPTKLPDRLIEILAKSVQLS